MPLTSTPRPFCASAPRHRKNRRTPRRSEPGDNPLGITNEPASELGQAVELRRGSYAVAPRICELAVLDLLFSRANAPTPPSSTRK